MPLKMCGSVSARLSVWFSRVRRRRRLGSDGVEHVEAAGIERRELRRRQRSRGATPARLQPASVRNRRPVSESRTRRARSCPGSRAPGDRASAAGRRSSGGATRKRSAFERDHDALADAAQTDHDAPFGIADGRERRADEEGVGDAEPFERLVQHARRERFQV